MFQKSGYIRHIIFSTVIVLLFIKTTNVQGQCGATSGTGLFDPIENNFCGGEKQVWVGKRFSSVDVPPGKDVYVQVDWGYPGAIEYYPTILNAGNYEINTGNTVTPVGLTAFPDDRYAYHEYPPGLEECEFIVEISIAFVNTGEDINSHPSREICLSSTNTLPTVYWDVDSEETGELDIERSPEITICEGQSVTIDPLENQTTYNCPLSNNNSERWFQWVYNTDGSNPIPDVIINGDNITAENFNTSPSGYTNPDFEEVIQLDPGPNNVIGDLDMDPTGEITIDGTNTAAGQTFDITLRAWNACNPFDDPDIPGNPALTDAANADFPPEEFTITIRVVAAPIPNPEVQDPNDASNWFDNSDPVTEFCAGEPVNFRQQTATGDDNFAWDFDWDGIEGNFNTQSTQQNPSFIYDASFIGTTVTVGLRITRGNIGEPCVFYETIQIDIIDTPQATISTDGDDTIESISYCEDELPLAFTFTDVTTGKNNQTTTQWEIFDINDNNITPTGSLIQANSNANYNPAELSPYTITSGMGPGRYRAVLSILDGGTNCSTSDTVDIFIYDTPEADFDTDDVCAGGNDPNNRTQFFNIANVTNGISPQVNGDEINRWMWDFSYDTLAGFNLERDVNNNNDFLRFLDGTDGPEPTQSQPGFYNVVLIVETINGCTDTVGYEVEVKHNPNSELEASYTNDYEGNLAGDTYTGDPICPGTLLTFTNTTNESLNDASVSPVSYELQIDSLGFIITRPIGAPGEPNESVAPNIFFNDGASIETYTIELVANSANGCAVISSPIDVDVLPGSASGFDIYDEPTYTDAYDPLIAYCSPTEFYFQIDNPTENLLDPGDSLVWEVYDGSTLLGGDTIEYSDPNYDQFSFEFSNEYPSIAAINYTIVLQPYVDGVCVNNSQRTVRVLPKPSSDFNPVDTVVTCDSVTYYFEAVQPGLLEYDWQVQTVGDTLSTQNDGVEFWVSYARPDIGDPNVNVEVRLQTENPFNCQSDLSDPFNDIILPKDDINIILDTVGNEFCAPAIYGFVNNTTDPVPPGTEWELIISNLDDGSTTIIDGTTFTGNEEFRESGTNIFEYEFTDSANYEIRLNALLPSTCDVASDPPISLGINETPTANFRTNISQGCSPLSIDLIGASTIPSGQDFILSYEVVNTSDNSIYYDSTTNVGDGSQLNGVTVPDLINTTDPFIDFNITVTAQSLAGCTNDSTVTVRVFQEPSLDFDIISPNPACQENYNFEFDISSLNVPAGTIFTWNWGDGQSLTTDQDTLVNHTYSNRASFFGNDSYIVTLTAETLENCTFSISDTVELNPRLQAQFNASTEQGCDPLNVTFTSSSLGTNISGGHEYYRRLQGDATWNPIDSISNTGTVSEYFENSGISTEIWEILYVVQGEGGCRDTAAIKEITVFPSPDFEVNVINSPLCQIDENGNYQFEFELNNVDIPAGTELTWNWGDGSTPLTTTSTANQTHIFNNRLSYFGTDNYTVTVTAESNNGCILNETVNIQLYPRIEALFFQNIDEGCSPLEVNFTSSSRGTGLTGNYIYQRRIQGSGTWNTITGGEANGSTSDTFENNTGSDIIYEIRHIVSSDLGNCSDTSSISEITVYPEFTTPAITGPNEVCSFQQEVVYSIPHNLGSTYNWQLPLGAFISSQNANGNQVKINFSSFSGDISVSEINDNGCIGAPSVLPVRVLSGPSVSLSLNGPNTICPGDETSLIFDLSGEGSQGFDVIYSDGVENDTLENINDGHIETITPTQSRNYFVLDVIDRQYPNCNAANVSGNAFVNVNFAPTASISGDATICEDGSTNLFINLTGAGPWEVVYTDQNSNYTIENISSPVYQLEVSPEVNTTYELVSVTDSNTPVCSGTVEGFASVVINPKPTANIFGNFNDICANESVELGLELTGYAPWTVRYTDGNNTFTIPNITPPSDFDPENDTYVHNFEVFPNTGTTNFTLVDVRDSNTPNCTGDISGTATITSYDRPIVEIEGDNTICLGESSPITFNFIGDAPFDVLITANQDTLEYNNLQDGQSVTLSPEMSTVYRVIELIDNRGCSGNSLGGPVSINVNNLPTSEISGNDITCYGEETELIFDQSGVGPWTITYTDGNQNFTFTTPFNRHFEPVFPTNTTTYSLVSVVDSNSPESCTGTVSGSALKEVYPELEASFEANPEEMVLPESTISITNTTTNKNEWEYEWDFGDGTTSTEVDPAPHEYGTFGTFVIRMTATNGQCTDTYQTSVTIGAIPPIVDFNATPTEGCLPLVVEFENLTQFADPSSYQWEFGDGQRVSAVENPTHIYRNPGTYTVTLSANNITGQRTEMIKEEFIVVNETPTASFTIPDEYRQVFTGEEVRFVNLSEGADEYIWKFGDGNESFEEEPIHAYPDSGIYDITLIAINTETGCTDSMTLSSQVRVILGGASDVPNAFTPSRAGPGTASSNPIQNDIFLPKVEGVSQFNMKIYNRWGELLFESNDRTEGWDGYYNGVLMPQGVYVYRLELVYENGRRETKIGDITLIR